MTTTMTDTMICVTVNDGCLSCPFEQENKCGCDTAVTPTHDYTYPACCPLLYKDMVKVCRGQEVER